MCFYHKHLTLGNYGVCHGECDNSEGPFPWEGGRLFTCTRVLQRLAEKSEAWSAGCVSDAGTCAVPFLSLRELNDAPSANVHSVLNMNARYLVRTEEPYAWDSEPQRNNLHTRGIAMESADRMEFNFLAGLLKWALSVMRSLDLQKQTLYFLYSLARTKW